MKVYPAVKGSPTGRVNIKEEHLIKSGIKLGDTVSVQSKKGKIVIRRMDE